MEHRQIEKTNYSVQVLFGMLDEAMYDWENRRVISAEEMWKELDNILWE